MSSGAHVARFLLLYFAQTASPILVLPRWRDARATHVEHAGYSARDAAALVKPSRAWLKEGMSSVMIRPLSPSGERDGVRGFV
jgi:hypothetical protein